MQVLRIVLALISIGCVLGPVGAVVAMHLDDLPQMVITPQLQQLMHSDNNDNSNNNGNYVNSNNSPNVIAPNGDNNNNYSNNNDNNVNDNNNQNIVTPNGDNNNNNDDSSNGLNPSFISGQIDTSKKAITLTFSITNNDNQDATINSMSGAVEITMDQCQLGTLNLNNAPITIHSGQTVSVTVSGALTQVGQTDLAQHYSGSSSVDVSVINGAITANGITYFGSSPQDIGNIEVIS
jgi:hypothetical protein